MKGDLLTTQGRVLLCIARDPSVKISSMVQCLGVESRTVWCAVQDLKKAGYITVGKKGRRNCYEIHDAAVPTHPADPSVGALASLAFIGPHRELK